MTGRMPGNSRIALSPEANRLFGHRDSLVHLCQFLTPAEICCKLRLLDRATHEAVDKSWCLPNVIWPSSLCHFRWVMTSPRKTVRPGDTHADVSTIGARPACEASRDVTAASSVLANCLTAPDGANISSDSLMASRSDPKPLQAAWWSTDGVTVSSALRPRCVIYPAACDGRVGGGVAAGASISAATGIRFTPIGAKRRRIMTRKSSKGEREAALLRRLPCISCCSLSRVCHTTSTSAETTSQSLMDDPLSRTASVPSSIFASGGDSGYVSAYIPGWLIRGLGSGRVPTLEFLTRSVAALDSNHVVYSISGAVKSICGGIESNLPFGDPRLNHTRVPSLSTKCFPVITPTASIKPSRSSSPFGICTAATDADSATRGPAPSASKSPIGSLFRVGVACERPSSTGASQQARGDRYVMAALHQQQHPNLQQQLQLQPRQSSGIPAVRPSDSNDQNVNGTLLDDDPTELLNDLPLRMLDFVDLLFYPPIMRCVKKIYAGRQASKRECRAPPCPSWLDGSRLAEIVWPATNKKDSPPGGENSNMNSAAGFSIVDTFDLDEELHRYNFDITATTLGQPHVTCWQNWMMNLLQKWSRVHPPLPPNHRQCSVPLSLCNRGELDNWDATMAVPLGESVTEFANLNHLELRSDAGEILLCLLSMLPMVAFPKLESLTIRMGRAGAKATNSQAAVCQSQRSNANETSGTGTAVAAGTAGTRSAHATVETGCEGPSPSADPAAIRCLLAGQLAEALITGQSPLRGRWSCYENQWVVNIRKWFQNILPLASPEYNNLGGTYAAIRHKGPTAPNSVKARGGYNHSFVAHSNLARDDGREHYPPTRNLRVPRFPCLTKLTLRGVPDWRVLRVMVNSLSTLRIIGLVPTATDPRSAFQEIIDFIVRLERYIKAQSLPKLTHVEAISEECCSTAGLPVLPSEFSLVEDRKRKFPVIYPRWTVGHDGCGKQLRREAIEAIRQAAEQRKIIRPGSAAFWPESDISSTTASTFLATSPNCSPGAAGLTMHLRLTAQLPPGVTSLRWMVGQLPIAIPACGAPSDITVESSNNDAENAADEEGSSSGNEHNGSEEDGEGADSAPLDSHFVPEWSEIAEFSMPGIETLYLTGLHPTNVNVQDHRLCAWLRALRFPNRNGHVADECAGIDSNSTTSLSSPRSTRRTSLKTVWVRRCGPSIQAVRQEEWMPRFIELLRAGNPHFAQVTEFHLF